MKAQGQTHIYPDNVDTDVIIPARYLNTSDPKELASHCMCDIDADFVNKVKPGDIMVAGWNFGCGSSREHAPIAIKESGISCVIAKSFARIHKANLINFGILPLTFVDEADYDGIDEMDELVIEHVRSITPGQTLTVYNKSRQTSFSVSYELSALDVETLKAGGTLNLIRQRQENKE